MELREYLIQCELDTRNMISPNAANRLAQWRNCQSVEKLTSFIQRMIRKEENKVNGWEISRRNGISLESIVLDHCPDLFSPEDKQIAAETLGRES